MMTFKETMEKSYFHPERYPENWENDLEYVYETILEKLKVFNNFKGIDFCDVSANGIQIRGFHKMFPRYSFGNQATIKYNFSNLDDAIRDFVLMWVRCDNEEHIKEYKDFIEWGEKYGWD